MLKVTLFRLFTERAIDRADKVPAREGRDIKTGACIAFDAAICARRCDPSNEAFWARINMQALECGAAPVFAYIIEGWEGLSKKALRAAFFKTDFTEDHAILVVTSTSDNVVDLAAHRATDDLWREVLENIR